MFAGKEIRILLRGQAKESFIELKKRNDKEAQSILNSFERVKNILKQNPQYGNPIAKELIPEQLKKTRNKKSLSYRIIKLLENALHFRRQSNQNFSIHFNNHRSSNI